MSDEVIGLSLQLNGAQAVETVGTIKQQLKEANEHLLEMSEKFGLSSEKAAEAAEKVAELRDKIGDARQLIDGFNPDRKFEALSGSIRGVAGGFAALQGSMALFGERSEDTQKALLKVQAALALSEGVNSILELKDTFKVLGTTITNSTIFIKANDLATKVAAATQRLFGVSVNTTSTSFKLLKGAIAASGIGLLVIALGEAVSALQSFTSAANRAAEAQADLNKSIIEGAQAGLKGSLDFIERDGKILILQAKKAGKSQEEISKIEISNQKLRIAARQSYLDEVRGKGKEEIEAETELKNEKTKLRELELQNEVDVNDKKRQLSKKSIEDAKNKSEAERKRLEEEKKKNREAANQTEDEIRADLRKLATDDRGKELLDLQDNYAKKLAIIQKAGGDEIALNRWLRLERNRINDEFDLQEKEKQEQENKEKDARIMDAASAAISRNADYLLQLTDNNKKQKEDEARDEENLANFKVQTWNRVAQASEALSELVGRQTAAGKALGAATAIINTWVGVTEILRNKTVLPEPLGTINKIASIAGVVAAGFGAVKNIMKTQVPGGGGGISMPSAGAATSAPLSPQLSSTNINQNQINQIGNAAVKAFIVESDVTNNQQKIRNINRAARLS